MPSMDDFDTLLDLLALAGSALLIFFLLCNRLKYGRFYLGGRAANGRMDFSGELAFLTTSENYQKAHDHLQQVLTREFESLGMTGGRRASRPVAGRADEKPREGTAGVHGERHPAFRLAEEMITRGEDDRDILRQCHLVDSELELLRGLRQLAEEGSR